MSNSSVNILEAEFNPVCPVSSRSFCCLIKMISCCLPEFSCLLFVEMMDEESYLILHSCSSWFCKLTWTIFSLARTEYNSTRALQTLRSISMVEHQGTWSVFVKAPLLKFDCENEATREFCKMQILIMEFRTGLRVCISNKYPHNACWSCWSREHTLFSIFVFEYHWYTVLHKFWVHNWGTHFEQQVCQEILSISCHQNFSKTHMEPSHHQNF